jgi:predicted acyl esterase
VPATFYDGDSNDLWRTDVQWNWQEPAPGTAATFTSPPMTDTTVMVGSASADLWVNSNLGDTDLEVTLSEIRPDGQEMYVQSGWLRASHRALDEAGSTEQRPVQTHLEADAEPLPDGSDDTGFALARVEIFPFAHVFRPDSRIRITIDAPGGNRAVWAFETIANGELVQLGTGGDHPSSIVLPVIPGVEAPAGYPICGSLRGQPCRTPVVSPPPG